MSNLHHMQINGFAFGVCLWNDGTLAILTQDAIKHFELEDVRLESIGILGSKIWLTKKEFAALLMFSVLTNNVSPFAEITVSGFKNILEDAERELNDKT